MRSMKRAALFVVLVCVSAASQGQEADAPVSPSVAPPLSPAAAESARQAEKIRQLEAEIQNLRDESHAAAESIQDRMDDSNQHLNRVLLIFAAAALLVVLLSAHNIRLRQRAANQRIEESVREAQTLFRDLRRHLAAPEMQHMRVSQSLRELMRRLRDESFAGLSEAQSRMVREAAADMHLPAALHFMAVAMRDEQNGDWEKASAALNRLREMDPDDPDILLHLAHVHAKLAESSPDPKARARNRRLAHQYYTRFTMALRTIKMEDAPAPAPRAYIQIPTPPAPPAPPPKPLEFPEPKIAPAPAVPAPPPTIETVPPPTPTQPTQPTPTQPTHPTQPVASTPSTPSTPPAPLTRPTQTAQPTPEPTPTPKPSQQPIPPMPSAQPSPAPVAQTSPAPTPEPTPPSPPPPPSPPSPPVKPAFVPPPEPAPPMRSATPFLAKPKPTPASVDSSAPPSRKKKRKRPSSLPPPPTPPGTEMISAPNNTAKGAKFFRRAAGNAANVLGKSAAALKRAGPAAIKMRDGIGKLTGALAPKEEVLPPLPVPELTAIPPDAIGPEALMWRAIRAGDQAMAQALPARTFRERHRKIDHAIGLYAEAQSHKTNDVLYFNWGLALLGKALNTPDKKRAVFLNAAVDKFMAGNVVRPGAFNFHLASLYALMNDGENCRKWLRVCAESDSLDAAALRAPDFDAVRNHSWFREFERR